MKENIEKVIIDYLKSGGYIVRSVYIEGNVPDTSIIDVKVDLIIRAKKNDNLI